MLGAGIDSSLRGGAAHPQVPAPRRRQGCVIRTQMPEGSDSGLKTGLHSETITLSHSRHLPRFSPVRSLLPDGEEVGVSVNLYTTLSAGVGTSDAAALSGRLAAWHDAMVAHDRRLRSGLASARCDDDCPHAEARLLWAEAVTTFGDRAAELGFLRSRAQAARSMSAAVR